MIVTLGFLILYRIKKYPRILSIILLTFYFKCLQSGSINLYMIVIGALLILSYEDILYYAVYTRHLRMLEMSVFFYYFMVNFNHFLFYVFNFFIAFGLVSLYSSFFYLVTKKKGMGEADFEVIALLYMISNFRDILMIVWLSCLIGIIYMVIKKKNRIPFILFLTIASILILA